MQHLKNLLIVCLIASITPVKIHAQSFKGKERVNYFQAPAKEVQFATANVFVNTDIALRNAKKEASQKKVSKLGSKLGGFGKAVSGLVNKAIDITAETQNILDAAKNEKGHFSTWQFIPPYILYDRTKVKKKVNVEIFVLPENPKNPMGMDERLPSKPGNDGYYLIPWSVNCRYQVTDARGTLIMEDNLGLISGKTKTKHFKPATAPKKVGTATISEGKHQGMSASYEIAINQAYNRVRKEVFAQYGFGQFSVPSKLGKVKEIKALKKQLPMALNLFENKKGLLLNQDEKNELTQYVETLEQNINKCSDKTRWVAYHNLSVCYAWLEDIEKSQQYIQAYRNEIADTFGKMEVFSKLVKMKLSKEERMAAKEKYGSLAIGTKDMKKYSNYKAIETFVRYYPKGANSYPKLLFTINRNLAQFVDYYAHNDLLCQIFEIDYPFQFLPLQEFKGTPKAMSGQIIKDGSETIEYKVKFDSKRHIKQLNASKTALTSEGKKDKIHSRNICPVYNKDGRYTNMTIVSPKHKRYYFNAYDGEINEVYTPLVGKTYGEADNITRKTGFFKDRESSEKVQLRVSLDGVIYFNGKSKYPRVNAIFREILDGNGVVPKRPYTSTKFNTKALINNEGVFTEWDWHGSATSFLGNAKEVRNQKLSAQSMDRNIKFSKADDKGNPVKVNYDLKIDGKVSMKEKIGFKNTLKWLFLDGVAPQVASDQFKIASNIDWNCKFKYDEKGNWVEMQVGPYIAKREFKY